jgi:hypothetical protein
MEAVLVMVRARAVVQVVLGPGSLAGIGQVQRAILLEGIEGMLRPKENNQALLLLH